MPVHRFVEPDFYLASVAMVAHIARSHEVHPRIAKGSNLAEQRNDLVRQARALGCDRLLWCDVDHVFPPDAFDRLEAHGLPVVGCNYPVRLDASLSSASRGGDRVKPGRGVEPVDALGLGLCLVRMEVFDRMKEPWFACPPKPGGGVFYEDDWFFTELARQTGIRPCVDHDLSAQVGHSAASAHYLPPVEAQGVYRFRA